ncbi:hypothetical protein [Phytobacter massiliensis]|uniref:hypothetical protein n=1 Tax=Phytobacter massiliensis TaxID=1485952 RepID=UPI001F3B9421|nr:hypothetical protein [Phytobacter massiliensis]
MRIDINGLGTAKSYINKRGKELGKDFQKTLIRETRDLSIKMQKELNESIDKGAVPFTSRAILFTYKLTGTGVSTSILVKDLQAKYLYDVLVKPKAIEKFIPTSAARLTKQGNITGLRNNLRKGRYKIVNKGGKERLIDTAQRKQDRRVIGLREDKRRKLIYDFYEKGEQGAILIVSNIRGRFKVKKQ